MIDVSTIHAFIDNKRKVPTNIKIVREYFNGKNAVLLPQKVRMQLQNLLGNSYSDNICKTFVEEAAGRIKFIGFSCPNKRTEDFLAEWCKISKFRFFQTEFIQNMLIDGLAAIVVTPEEGTGRVVVRPEKWWDGNEGIYIFFDSNRNATLGVSEWTGIDNITYRMIRDNDSALYCKSNDKVTWEVIPLNASVNSKGSYKDTGVGMAYIMLRNHQRPSGAYAISDIYDVPGDQDQLNDAMYMLSFAVRLTGYQVYYATGVSNVVSTDGNEQTADVNELNVDCGEILTSPNTDSKFGVLPPGPLAPMIEAYLLKLRRAYQKNSVPFHYITGGDWPSGEALIRAEQGAINKAATQIEGLEQMYVQAAVYAIKLHNYLNDDSIPVDIQTAPITAKFIDPEKRDRLAMSSIIHNLSGGVSIKEGLRLMGYEPSDIDKIYEEMLQEMKDGLKKDSSNKQPSGGLTGNANQDVQPPQK